MISIIKNTPVEVGRGNEGFSESQKPLIVVAPVLVTEGSTVLMAEGYKVTVESFCSEEKTEESLPLYP
jgi:hypothetical protein